MAVPMVDAMTARRSWMRCSSGASCWKVVASVVAMAFSPGEARKEAGRNFRKQFVMQRAACSRVPGTCGVKKGAAGEPRFPFTSLCNTAGQSRLAIPREATKCRGCLSDQLGRVSIANSGRAAMAEHNANRDSPISESLHPLVNMAIIGLLSMFVAAVWMFFDSDPYGAWLDVVITGLFVVAIAILALCWLTWRRNA